MVHCLCYHTHVTKGKVKDTAREERSMRLDYELVDFKCIIDNYGRHTHYIWYKNPECGNVFIIGNVDSCTPENSEWHFDIKDDAAAINWFERYNASSYLHEAMLLNEVTLKRIMNGHGKSGYAVISAYKDENSPTENNRKTEELRQLLIKAPYTYIPVFEGYKELIDKSTEQTVNGYKTYFMVFPIGREAFTRNLAAFEKFVIDMCIEFDQDSFFIKRSDEDAGYWKHSADNEHGEGNKQIVNRHSYFEASDSMYCGIDDPHVSMPGASIMGSHARYAKGELNNPNLRSEAAEHYRNNLSYYRYWYFTTNGVQAGSVPKDCGIDEIADTPNGSYFLADRMLKTNELRLYDIRERIPSQSILDK